MSLLYEETSPQLVSLIEVSEAFDAYYHAKIAQGLTPEQVATSLTGVVRGFLAVKAAERSWSFPGTALTDPHARHVCRWGWPANGMF